MKPGIYTADELSNEDYHAGDGVSSTVLKELIKRSPAHCRALMDGLRSKTSNAMNLGTVVHTAVLEPHRFWDQYWVAPERSEYPDALETTEEYRAAAERFGIDLQGKSSKEEIRPLLEAASSDLVFWEDLVAAAPSKDQYPDALDSLADYKAACTARGLLLQGKATKGNMHQALVDAGVHDGSDLGSIDAYKDACASHGILLPAEATKPNMRAALERFGADVVFWDDLAAQIPSKADYPHALDSLGDYRKAAERLGINLSAKTTKADIRAALESAGAPVTFWDDLRACPEGKAEITRAQADIASGILASVQACPNASALLCDGVAELSFFWVDPATGELCKVRPDNYLESSGMVADLKTCDDARPHAVQRAIYNYGYDLSAAMYLDGVAAQGKPANGFAWVFAETAPPYAVRVYIASDALLEQARKRYRRGLEQFSMCRLADSWPGYPSETVEIDLPAWAEKETEVV